MPHEARPPKAAVEPPPSTTYQRLGLLVLVAFAMCTTLTHLTGGPPMGDHECINAQAARQVVQSGQWLIPYVGEIPRVRKTPLGIWLIATASKLFDGPLAALPVTDFSARLPSALSGFGITLVLFWLGRMMYGYTGGLMAGFVWAASAGAIVYSRVPRGDMILGFFTALAFACFWRGVVHTPKSKPFLAAFYVAFALAMMTKAPLPLATVGMGLALYWLVTVPLLQAAEATPAGPREWLQASARASWQQFKAIPSLWILPGTLLFLVLCGAWPLYVIRHVSNARELWRAEYVDMFLGDMTDKHEPFWYYPPIVIALLIPYALSVFEAVAAPFMARYRAQREGLAFAFTWAVWGTFFLSLSAVKRENYLLSVMPGYCLLLAPVIERLFTGTIYVAPRLLRTFCTVLPGALAAGAVAGAFAVHRSAPSLLSAYVVVGLLVWAAWTWACWSFARGQRLWSFAQMNLAVLIVLFFCWPVVGQHVRINADADDLADALRQHGVTPQDEVIRVDGRPDSSIEFYHGFRVRRLLNELEMAGLHRSRGERTLAVYAEYAKRIEQKLRQDRAVYMFMASRNYDLLSRNIKGPWSVLCRVPKPGPRNDAIIVITQPRPATAPAS